MSSDFGNEANELDSSIHNHEDTDLDSSDEDDEARAEYSNMHLKSGNDPYIDCFPGTNITESPINGSD
jgi:hypothetical protein